MLEYKRVMEHIEVYEDNKFILSADTLKEVEEEYKLLCRDESKEDI